MKNKIGLLLFILGCFGMLQIALGIDKPIWELLAMTMILLGGYMYVFSNEK
jgi:hypothetical protein